MCEQSTPGQGLTVTCEQLAEVLGTDVITVRTIKRLFDAGDIPGVRIGTKRLVSRKYFDQVLAAVRLA